MKNTDHNLEVIKKLKELGVRIALDNFGTGHSSFNYLTRLPIDTLKIDTSYISRISSNDNDAYIAETIINLAHKIGITVIAEGVENEEQKALLERLNCDILQGYLFSKAVTDEEIIELLKEGEYNNG